jgi:hypothetical protein
MENAQQPKCNSTNYLNFKMLMLFENLIKLSSFIGDKNSKVGSIKGIHTEKSHWQTGSHN